MKNRGTHDKLKIIAVLILIAGGFGAVGLAFIMGTFIVGYLLAAISNYSNSVIQSISSFIMIPVFASIPKGILAIILGILILKYRKWNLSLIGAIISVFIFFPSGIPAIIISIKAKSEYNIPKPSLPMIDNSTSLKKNKNIALILAIIFGPFTWLYTYRRDAGKAAVGLGIITLSSIYIVGAEFFLNNVVFKTDLTSSSSTFNPFPLIFLSLIIIMPIWLWAIIDVAAKNEWTLDKIEKKKKSTAILLAIFLNLWTWLYTYKKDAWKFWLSFIVSYGTLIVIFINASYFLNNIENNSSNSNLIMLLLPIIPCILSSIIFIFAIINTTIRSKEWYENFNHK